MKDKFTKNLNLKIIAVLFAAGLWMISININDPYQSKDYSVVVQLLNMNVMTTSFSVMVLSPSPGINRPRHPFLSPRFRRFRTAPL